MPASPNEVVAFTILTAGASIAALIAVVVTYVVQAGPRRAGLVPLAAAASMVGPLVGIGAASKHLAQTFGDMAASGSGGAAALIAGCSQAQRLMLVGDVGAIITLVLASGLGWLGARNPRPGSRPDGRVRSLGPLLALSVLPVLAVASLHEYARATNRIAVGVAEAPTAKPGDSGEGPVVVQALVSRMSSGVLLGALGAPALLVLLVAVAVITTILGWNAAVPEAVRMAGTALLLAAAAAAVVGALLFERPVVLPR
jgi:hypothetical protein